mmetsp:Transcript_111987/g.239224  ORF Transcript_111987/g.239224 Transcript_111987/m.239224 type:complete len:236 (+) Transcript_111987:1123-1830(+)
MAQNTRMPSMDNNHMRREAKEATRARNRALPTDPLRTLAGVMLPFRTPSTFMPREPKRWARASNTFVSKSNPRSVNCNNLAPCQNCIQRTRTNKARWISACTCMTWLLLLPRSSNDKAASRGSATQAASNNLSKGQHAQKESQSLCALAPAPSCDGSSISAFPLARRRRPVVPPSATLTCGCRLRAMTLKRVGTVVTIWLTHHGSHSKGKSPLARHKRGPPKRKEVWNNTHPRVR